MQANRTMRQILISYVEIHGPQTWTDLHKVVMAVAGKVNKKYGISYLDNVSKGTSALIPTNDDRRYLKKNGKGLYELHTA